ncbi:RHS repeat domain-containing protein [Microbacterium sp. Marseille-Q6965]|uniref:RHS repeat domain-containing protein n=1 Tax=Microbacterium sp. Marseille-Q6965 TaxID=2965072 RepID=UPI0021B710E0|nr:hypothetical protein [Microbacterium sp. Marseille-Q6965]
MKTRPSGGPGTRFRAALAAVTAALVASTTFLVASPAAAATPVYEIKGAWLAQPDSISRGNPVVAEWRINVNDADNPPVNEPVQNVVATFAVEKAFFDEIPDACLRTGVDPVSSLSADGTALTCNFGPVAMGTALVLQTPVVANGVTGEEIALAGTSPSGEVVDLPRIPIANPFVMDIHYGQNTNLASWNADYTAVDVDVQWSLRLGKGSDPGPDSVTYRLTVADSNGGTVQRGTNPRTGDLGCSPFDSGNASGHPWSTVPSHFRHTNFVGSCTLTAVPGAPGQFDLTLSGINYDLLNSPTQDAGGGAGTPLPTDYDYIASGSLWFHILTDQAGSVSVTSNAPTYEAPTGQRFTDLVANNRTTKSYTLPGGWSAGYRRDYTGSGGTTWDDTYRVSPGTVVNAYVSNTGGPVTPTGGLFGNCIALDTAYVEYVPVPADTRFPEVIGVSTDASRPWSGLDNPPPVEYYTGPVGDPDQFDCGTGTWSTTMPEDPADVTAVRIRHEHAHYAAEDRDNFQLNAYMRVRDNVAVGRDVWTFGSILRNGVWTGPNAGNRVTDTPDARYPYTTGRRDILRITTATPFIQKAAERATVTPGVPTLFTLRYSANGSGIIPETVDGYEIVDTLPVGMTYEPGSATPEPAITIDAQGRQVLTWTLNDVPTNEAQTLTYQAVTDTAVEPGTRLTNTVFSRYGGADSRPAAATVTTTSNGYTTILKTADLWFIPNRTGDGDGTGSWTVEIESRDPESQAYTDTIDILPYKGDQRGTSFSGTYTLDDVVLHDGGTVYYTDADPATLSDDPAHEDNGAPNAPSDLWTTERPENPTAIRVIGGELVSGGTFSFQVLIATDGAQPQDVYVNRAQARAEHTELVMRTSASLTMGTWYAATLKKYVQDLQGEWRDANEVDEYPSFRIGDTVNYRVVVENIGQGTLENIVVSDDQQPELGAVTIDVLDPGETFTHEYSIVLEDGAPETLVNNACAEIPEESQPADTEPVTIDCDPAGLEVVGDPTHVKELVSASPIGDGRWEVVYGIDVTNEDAYDTTYHLDDTLHFAEEAEIVSAEVTAAPEGVTLATPAWDGQGNVRIAAAVPLLAADDEAYAPHRYEVTVIAEVPLWLDGAGSGDDDPTRCGEDGDDTDRAFNNTSALTDPSGTVEDDQACAEIPSIRLDKSVASGPTASGVGRWTIVYAIVAENAGGAAGTYDLYDKLLFGEGIEIVSSEVASAPAGVTPAASWTGLGEQKLSDPNRIAADVVLDSGAAHTYSVRVEITAEASDLSASARQCPAPGSGDRGGLANSAALAHNGHLAEDDVCPPLPAALAATGGVLMLGVLSTALLLLIGGGGFLLFRRRMTV